MKKKKTKKKKNFWKPNYKESWNYLKESRKFIYFVLVVFLLFVILGAVLPVPETISEKILEFMRQLLEKTEGMSFSELTGFIFFNNLESSFFGMIFGVILGIYSVLTAIANGYILGFVSSKAVSTEGIFVISRLFPHGIFELPAVIVSLGLGVRLGTFIFQKKKMEFLKKNLWNSLRVFLFIILPLLLLAAIIEASLIYF